MSFSKCLFAFDFSKYLHLDSIGYRVIGLPIDIYSVGNKQGIGSDQLAMHSFHPDELFAMSFCL